MDMSSLYIFFFLSGASLFFAFIHARSLFLASLLSRSLFLALLLFRFAPFTLGSFMDTLLISHSVTYTPVLL
jgi:hypothetical protein